MRTLLWLVQARVGHRYTRITRRLVKLAINAYKNSGDRTRVHEEIQTWVKKTMAWKPDSSFSVLQKVVELIETNRFEPPESYKKDANWHEYEESEDSEVHHGYWSLDQEEPESMNWGASYGIFRRERNESDTSTDNANVFKRRWSDRNLIWRDTY
jgi:hypothetical protein